MAKYACNCGCATQDLASTGHTIHTGQLAPEPWAPRGAHTNCLEGGKCRILPYVPEQGFPAAHLRDTAVAFAAFSSPTTWITYTDGHSDFGSTPEVDEYSISGSPHRSANRDRTGGFSSWVLRTYVARRSSAVPRPTIPGHGDGGTPEGERASQGGEG